jgi:hypothetical protein
MTKQELIKIIQLLPDCLNIELAKTCGFDSFTGENERTNDGKSE